MSILDNSKLYCKNSYITSILVKKKFVDDPKDTANIFIIFIANLGKASYRKGNLAQVNHSPSFYLRVIYAESIYVSVISHEIWTLIEVFRSISVPVTILKSIRDYIHQVVSTFIVNASFTSGNVPDKSKLARITAIFKTDSRFDKDS